MRAETEIGRVRAKLWDVLDRLEDEDLDEDEAEARVGVLDSLVELLRIEQMCKERRGDAQQRATEPTRRT